LHLHKGSKLHGYKLLQFIDQGGFGDVWLVENGLVGVYYALKVVYRSDARKDRRYSVELRAVRRYLAAAARSSSLLRINHAGPGLKGNYFFYVMELADNLTSERNIIPGSYHPKTLSNVLAGCGRLDEGRAMDVALNLLEGLTDLHEHGLIHEDIKPANIVFVNGKAKLGDPGLVTFTHEFPRGRTKGYSSVDSAAALARDDTYAMGKVLFEMITGCNRFDFEKYQSNHFQQDSSTPASFSVWSIIAKACAKDPVARYQSALDMKKDLERFVRQRIRVEESV
jgi:serine/threonine protein kinase